MNKAAAIDRIKKALQILDQSTGETVFDEWALIQNRVDGWTLLGYGGHREDTFVAEFPADLAALRKTLDAAGDHVGEFAFTHEGYGSGFDAYICAGQDLFILFNHTEKSTGDITSNPKWKKAQVYFSELVETFISDPIV